MFRKDRMGRRGGVLLYNKESTPAYEIQLQEEADCKEAICHKELSDESRQMGLKMNITRTKVMVVDNTPINVNNVLIENVPGYVYLGQHYSLKEKTRTKRYNSCVLPAMTYGAETWTLTKQAQNKLAAAQTKMERSMLNITYKDRRTNIWVRDEQCRLAASKGNQVLGMIRRNITYKEKKLIVPLYIAIVRPHLEYCIQAWSPCLRKDIDMLDKNTEESN